MEKKNISILTLSLLMFMTVFGITNIANNYAAFGNSAIGWFILVAMYFIPLALIMSEMSTHKDCEQDNSGLSAWIKLGLGEGWGFIGSWCFFIANSFYLPMLASRIPVFLSWVFTDITSLEDVVASGGTIDGVVTASSNQTLFLLMAFVVIIITIIAAIFFEKIFAFLGHYIGYISLAVTALFIGLAILSVPLLGVAIANPITLNNAEVTGIIPSFNSASLSTFAWVLFSIAGIETVGSYVGRISNPEKKVPKGIILSATLIISSYILGFVAMSFILTPDQVPSTSMENLLPIMYAQIGVLWGFGPLFLKVIMLLFAIITMTALVLWMSATISFLFDRFPEGILPEKITDHKINGVSTLGIVATSTVILLFLIISNSNGAENVYALLYDMSTIAVIIPYLLVGVAYMRFKARGERGDFRVTKSKNLSIFLGAFVTFVTFIGIFFSTWDLSKTDMVERVAWLVTAGGGLLFFIMIGVTFYMAKVKKLYMYMGLATTIALAFLLF